MMGHDPGDPEAHAQPRTMRNYRTGGTPRVVIIDPEIFIPQLRKMSV
ncbi:MAG: hypothetical protein MI756_09785 [Chromatiales bacterium]|nr:hypothetical protein [Chromatiales bacterium]